MKKATSEPWALTPEELDPGSLARTRAAATLQALRRSDRERAAP